MATLDLGDGGMALTAELEELQARLSCLMETADFINNDAEITRVQTAIRDTTTRRNVYNARVGSYTGSITDIGANSQALMSSEVPSAITTSEAGLAGRLGAYSAASAEGGGLAGYLMVNSEIAANVGAMISSSATAGTIMSIGAIGVAVAGAYLTYQGIANAMENTVKMIADRKEAMRIAYRIQVFDHIQKTNPTMWAQLEANYGSHQQHARELPGQPPINDDLLSKIDQQITTTNDAYWHNLGWSRNSPSLQGLISERPTNTIPATVAAGAAAHAALPYSSDMHLTSIEAGKDAAESGGEAVVAGDVAVTAAEAAALALGGPEALAVGAAGFAVGTAYESGKEAITKAEESYNDLMAFWDKYESDE
jgi:hypothetical protein